MAQKRGLGKGLDALFVDNDTQSSGTLVRLRLSQIEPNKLQPRKEFDEQSLNELAESISDNGVLQPIVVRQLPGGNYQIIAGERRWRASRLANQFDIPAIILDADDSKTAELALIENLQREDLNPVEEARGYQALMEAYGLTQEQVAQKVGKSRPSIANSLRLLNLPEEAQEKLSAGLLTTGHARVLAGIDNKDLQGELLKKVIAEDLSVRQLEKLAKDQKVKPVSKTESKKAQSWGNSKYKEMELSLSDAISTKVAITKKGDGGIISIEFYNDKQLQDLAKKLTRE